MLISSTSESPAVAVKLVRRRTASGGADQFLRFIEKELKPWVDERYRMNGYSILMGHSLSGLFGMHAFVTQPDAFDAARETKACPLLSKYSNMNSNSGEMI